jgi:hypothetical protein
MSGMEIKSYLTALATGNATPDGHSVYILYLPPNVGILDNKHDAYRRLCRLPLREL